MRDQAVDAMRQRLGEQLRVARVAVGMTQAELAKLTMRERTGVAHIEAGRRGTDAEFWSCADRVCGADGALVRAHVELTAAENRARSRALRTPSDNAKNLHEPVVVTDQPGSSLVLSTRSCETLRGLTAVGAEQAASLIRALRGLWITVDRRTLIRVLALALAEVGVSADSVLDPDEQERVAQSVVSPKRIDASVLDDLGAVLSACKRQNDRFGPTVVLGMVLAQRDLARSMLRECPDAMRARLLSLYADLCSAAGAYLLDMGHPVRALQSLRAARAAAHKANDHVRGCYAACQISFQADFSGAPHDAADMASAAQTLGAQTDDMSLRALAHQMNAAACATNGQESACLTAYETAADALASARGGSPESPAYWLNANPVFLESQKCSYLLRLGRNSQAATLADSALAQFDPTFVGGHARLSIYGAAAHLRCGRVEQSCDLLGSAAGLVMESPSPRLTAELRAARGHMNRWENTASVKLLDEQLVTLGFAFS